MSIVRSYQNLHMDTNSKWKNGFSFKLNVEKNLDFLNKKDWDDIGYNFVVGEDGNIYEGMILWIIKSEHNN